MAVRNMALCGLFAALLALSSQVVIPLGPVPHTLQIFFVLLAGMILGSRFGAISVLVWVALGIFGLPVFAQGKAGLSVVAGPTGGFLLGFVCCAFVVGWLTERIEGSYGRTAAVMLLGLAIAYGIGLIGFMFSFKYFLAKTMNWYTAATLAVIPFLPFDLIKTLMAAYIGVRIRRALIHSGLVGTHK
ncbi:MAG: biotin transporter BioY [Veillonellales bacterium]